MLVETDNETLVRVGAGIDVTRRCLLNAVTTCRDNGGQPPGADLGCDL